MASMQDVFAGMDMHLLNDEQPSLYFDEISNTPLFLQYPFNLLSKMKQTNQSPRHHPEGNVWNHTMLVVDEAAKVKNESQDKSVFMWAALLHDIGKPDTTKDYRGKITSYDHDKIGAKLSKKFLIELTGDDVFIEKVAVLIRWHMQILFVVNGLPFADVKEMKKQSSIKEIALLGLCDRLGRSGANRKLEESNIKIFIQKCEINKC